MKFYKYYHYNIEDLFYRLAKGTLYEVFVVHGRADNIIFHASYTKWRPDTEFWQIINEYPECRILDIAAEDKDRMKIRLYVVSEEDLERGNKVIEPKGEDEE